MKISKLEDYLKEKRISVPELAKMVGITPQAINKALKKNDMYASNLFNIAKALKLPLSFFDDDLPSSANEPPVEYKRLTTNLIDQKDKYISRLEKDIEKLEAECDELRALKKGSKCV